MKDRQSYILAFRPDLSTPMFWSVPYERGGRWTPDRTKAKVYSTHGAAVIARGWLLKIAYPTDLHIEPAQEAVAR